MRKGVGQCSLMCMASIALELAKRGVRVRSGELVSAQETFLARRARHVEAASHQEMGNFHHGDEGR